jgi:hypothetical protein
LIALRGLDLEAGPDSPVDRERIRALFTTPVTQVTRVSRPWRRNGRRFIQVRLSTDDIRRLNEAPPFAWSAYSLEETDGQRIYQQSIGPSALRPGTLPSVGWSGGELVGFRLHLPSRILDHNARDLEADEPLDVERGNILRWEQLLTDRLDGAPITVEVRMDSDSILHTTLWLFGGAFVAAMLLLALLIWLTVRRGAREPDAAGPAAP